MQKVCLVTCYRDPNYIRVRTLQKSIELNKSVKLYLIRNTNASVWRYIQCIVSLVAMRIKNNPDVYIVTFRGYEILPFVLCVAFGKKVIFDEFINPLEWIIYEHKKIRQSSFIANMFYIFYRYTLKKTALILTDTASHAEYSSKLMDLPLTKYFDIPVSTDESVFKLSSKKSQTGSYFKVFYYGSMLPLHGIDYVINAAVELKDESRIKFVIIGGSEGLRASIDDAISKGANIDYRVWVPFGELTNYITEADICLGGPFGATLQSSMVITGKTYQFLASGKAVIIGANGATGLFTDGENALVVRQGSVNELVSKIKWSYQNKERLYDIGLAGRSLYNKRYSNKIIAKRMNDILTNID